MSEVDENYLWDPSAASTSTVAIYEERLACLRGPTAAPELRLPPRDVEAQRAVAVNEGASRWAWVAALVLAAAAAFAWWLSADDATEPAIARADEAGDPAPNAALAGWQVERIEGDADCRSAQEAAADRSVDMGEVETGADASARLTRGRSLVEVHADSRLRFEAAGLSLDRGRIWAELVAAEMNTAPLTLRIGEATLQTRNAQLVAWFAPDPGEGEGAGFEVLRGELSFVEGETKRVVPAGEICRAPRLPAPVDSLGPFVCEAPTR